MMTQAQIASVPDPPSATVCAQAAAWIARLHGPERTAKVERGFRLWLAEDPSHQLAFDMANDLWTETECWPKPAASTFVRRDGPGSRLAWPRLIATAAATVAGIAMIIVACGYFYLRTPTFSTQVGEQRTLMLADGSRVYLNTNTRIVVRMDERSRTIELKNGEALFEVARDATRAFVVAVGGRKVEALGTTFVVRRDSDSMAVTLIEGKVGISGSHANLSAVRTSSSIPQHPLMSPDEIDLYPGQRATFAGSSASPKLDRPPTEKVTAWQRNRIILDHSSLSEAVKEMNRYSSIVLTIGNPEAATAQITGVFHAGDSASFAQAVADAYQLQVTRNAREIVISGIPASIRP